jgi:osmotically-inducible protein OsmY
MMTDNQNARCHTLTLLLGAMLVGAAAGPLGGCAGMVIGAGATAATAAAEERGIGQAAIDLRIKVTISSLWLNHSQKLITGLDLNISEGRVLVTGVVPDETTRDVAVRLAWKAKGVREVINEIRIASGDGATGFARDGWITGQLRTRVTLDKQVQAINYAIETVGGTVYLIGIAQNAEELSRVRDHARALPYVRRIVSHVILKDDPRRAGVKNAATGTSPGRPQ